MWARRDARVRSRTSRTSTRTAPLDTGDPRQQVGEAGLAAAARPDQRDHFAGLHLEMDVLKLEAIGRSGVAESDMVEQDVVAKRSERVRVRFFHDLLGAAEVFENLLRGSESLLKDVVDADEALH